ncbi:hypothetical protein E0L36_26770 [Streptomyces sp. AJS327]|uniref:hypothetical protein n=1 Tax=Streptomyces sp. AJS327 TaxID=2545265 RepID=UPI0015DF453A|nr:hypothetical protein [Streptomyces sp. AJS327]MBA0054323.1 hypothetical protein [Streptomyces sp. AJS327]
MAEGRKMKVRVEITVEVDREEWSLAYGVEDKADAIRADVKTYVANGIDGASDAPITVVDWK